MKSKAHKTGKPAKRWIKKATFELPQEIHERLKVSAALQHQSMSGIITEALIRYFQQKKTPLHPR